MPTDTLTRVTADAVEFAFVCLILTAFVAGLALMDSEHPAIGGIVVVSVAAMIARISASNGDEDETV